MPIHKYILFALCLFLSTQGIHTLGPSPATTIKIISSGFLVKMFFNFIIKKAPLNRLIFDTTTHATFSLFMIIALLHSKFYGDKNCRIFEKIWYINACITYLLMQNIDLLFSRQPLKLKDAIESVIKTLVPCSHQITHNFPVFLVV
jgi:hypothetical protein